MPFDTAIGRLGRLQRALSVRYSLSKCDSVGPDARVLGSLRILNQGRIDIGARIRISGQPMPSHLAAQDGGTIQIGDDVSIGHGSGITARGLIRIGDGTRLGAFVLAMDTDYHVAGDARATAEIMPLQVGANVTIGNRVTLLRGSVIGDGARIVDGSVVRGIVHPGEVVEGVPARPVRSEVASGGAGSVEQRVRRLAQSTFRLARLPELGDGPSQIEAWDSLGALSFILAMEEEFGAVIGEDEMQTVRTLADAARLVESASEAH